MRRSGRVPIWVFCCCLGCRELVDADEYAVGDGSNASDGGPSGREAGEPFPAVEAGFVPSACATDCPDWSCVGTDPARPEYGWQDLDVTLRLTPFPQGSLDGVIVRACNRASIECDSIADETMLALPGEATLTVRSEGEGFLGHFRVEHPELPPTAIVRNGPFVPERTYNYSVVRRATFESLLMYIDQQYDDTRAYYSVLIQDCAGMWPHGVRLELDGADDLTEIYYWLDGLPSIEQELTAGWGASINRVPAGRVVVLRAIDSHTETLVARLELATLPGVYTQLVLLPLMNTVAAP